MQRTNIVGFQSKSPAWRNLGRSQEPGGYLRKSILLELGKKTGDWLPKDLLNAGIFEDSDTSSIVHDEVMGIRVTWLVQGYLDGVRDTLEDEEGAEEAGEDQGDAPVIV